MGSKDSRIDAYIGNSAAFAKPILKHLRRLVHAGCPDVQETIKWNFPHFDYKGVMCGMAAFKEHCTFGFWKAELILGAIDARRQAMGQFGCIKSISDLPSDRTLIGYVRKARSLNEAGIKVPGRTQRTKRSSLPMPDDIEAALRRSAKAKRVFDGFTPGQRREYIEWITGAKRADTRAKRLATALEWIGQGKVHNWRYLPK